MKPYGVAIKEGMIYVCDTMVNSIEVFDVAKKRARYFTPRAEGRLQTPINLTIDADGTRYVADTGRGQVLIYAKDMKTPVPNAVVKIRNVAKATEYESTPSDANGMYKITGIEDGRYVLGITAAKSDFNFDYALVLKGTEMAKLSVALQEGTQPPPEKTKKKSFFTSPAGIITLVIVAGAVLYGLFAKEEETSPIK